MQVATENRSALRRGSNKLDALCCVSRATGEGESAWSGGGLRDAVNILRIILRIFSNLLKELPLSPRKMKIQLRLRRRAAAWRRQEVERLDRIRNPAKYRGV
jgi:hypothetical protein